MDPEKLPMESADGTQINLDLLYQIAPSCFTEARGADGKVRRAVNFDVLRQLLGDAAVDTGEEFYQFTWPGKAEAQREAARSIRKTLRPYPDESVNWDTTQNLYIEGDNLEVLKLLQKSYMGKVKMIYIDPPYNTGKDFIYKDDYAKTETGNDIAEGNIDENGLRYRKNLDTNGRFHSDWCSMILSRLQIARTFLSNDGAIFISIDDHEVENVKKISNEVFGEKNYVATVIWQRTYAPISLKKYFSENHDFCLIYAKDLSCFDMNLLPRSIKQNKDYKNLDNDPRGPWKVGNLTVGPAVEKQIYEIEGPTGRKFIPPSGYCWRFTKEKFEQMRNDNRIWFGADGNNAPVPKLFLSEVQDGVTPMTVWTFDEVGHGQEATRELRDLMGSAVFTSPKPIRYLTRLLNIGSRKDSIIMDFFSGSATTAHSVLKMNAEDGGNRKFIMVQLPEETEEDSEARKDGYVNICEIGKERIRRAGLKIRETAGPHGQNLDTGFRVFKVDSSNMQDVDFHPAELSQNQLGIMVDNVKPDRTDLDLLFGAMIDWGVKLSLPMSKASVDGHDVYTVNHGELVACFAPNITEKVIEHVAAQSPVRVLFRDSCFDSDADKINIFEQFKQCLGWSDDEAKKNIRVI